MQRKQEQTEGKVLEDDVKSQEDEEELVTSSPSCSSHDQHQSQSAPAKPLTPIKQGSSPRSVPTSAFASQSASPLVSKQTSPSFTAPVTPLVRSDDSDYEKKDKKKTKWKDKIKKRKGKSSAKDDNLTSNELDTGEEGAKSDFLAASQAGKKVKAIPDGKKKKRQLKRKF